VRKKFYLDKRNGHFMGVCAGIANYFGIDATIVRIVAVVATLLGAAPWTFVLYGLIAWIGKQKPASLYEGEDLKMLRGSTYDVGASMRDIDRRMAEVETYVTTSNSRLAREIEELR
jgi:phage shock protein C